MTATNVSFRDWVPIGLGRRESETFVDWCYIADQRFTQPFFRDTIQRQMQEPFNLAFRHRTPIDFLATLAGESDVIPPTGFIFHMSRCGSTLISQMLARLKRNIVMSEPSPVDAVLKAENLGLPNGVSSGEWVRLMIGVLGRRRFDEEQNYFLKFDSWNTLDLALIRNVFPDVPWIFLYRNPIEVIVSQVRQRGSQMVPGAMLRCIPEMTIEDAWRMPGEEYCARVLAQFCSVALEQPDDRSGLLVNYNQLPDAFLELIANHFKLSFGPDELAKIEATGKLNAKAPRQTFEPDSELKRNEASEAMREAAARWVDPLYDALEKKRLAQTR